MEPIACSLKGAELPARLEQIAAIGREGLLDADGPGVLRFHPQVRARLAAVVAAEAKCCPFLTMSLSDAPGAIELRIEGPAAAEPVVRELAEAFTAAING